MSASIFSGLEYNGYGMIMADCPWLFKNWSKKGEGRNALAHYECMEIDEIKALPVRFLAAKDCCLFMWATNPMVDQQIDLMKAWGFKFKTRGSWEKVHASGKQCFGGGYILRSSNEPYIIGTVGKPKFSHSVRSSFRGLRREHSRKPEEGCAHAEAWCRASNDWTSSAANVGPAGITGAMRLTSSRRKTMPEPKKNLIAEVHNNRLKIRLSIGKDEITLDTYELETVIRALSERRAMMQEPVPMELEPNAGLNPLMNPPTVVGETTVGEKMGKTSMVALCHRHPGFGWQSQAYTMESARAVVLGIEKVLQKIDPMRTGSASKLILPGQ